MPKCGYCKRKDQTIAHIRKCRGRGGGGKATSAKDVDTASNRTSRGGSNFSKYGMVNPPPSGRPAKHDY